MLWPHREFDNLCLCGRAHVQYSAVGKKKHAPIGGTNLSQGTRSYWQGATALWLELADLREADFFLAVISIISCHAIILSRTANKTYWLSNATLLRKSSACSPEFMQNISAPILVTTGNIDDDVDFIRVADWCVATAARAM